MKSTLVNFSKYMYVLGFLFGKDPPPLCVSKCSTTSVYENEGSRENLDYPDSWDNRLHARRVSESKFSVWMIGFITFRVNDAEVNRVLKHPEFVTNPKLCLSVNAVYVKHNLQYPNWLHVW